MLTTTFVLWISCIFFTIIFTHCFTRTWTHATQNLLPTFLFKIKTDHVNPMFHIKLWQPNGCQFLSGRRAPLCKMISWQNKERIRHPHKYLSNSIKVKIINKNQWTVQFSLHAVISSKVQHVASRSRVWFSPSLRGSFVSFCLFSLLCWKALLGSNLRQGAPGSFNFSCSRSLFCRFTWDRSFDISYKHTYTARKKGGLSTGNWAQDKTCVWGLESRRCCSCASPVLGRYSHLSASSHVWSSASGFGGPADEHKHQTTCLTPPGLLRFHWVGHFALLRMHWAVPVGTHKHKYWVCF